MYLTNTIRILKEVRTKSLLQKGKKRGTALMIIRLARSILKLNPYFLLISANMIKESAKERLIL